ncbi:Ig-like domain-containing protein [Leucobacter sp. HY1908]
MLSALSNGSAKEMRAKRVLRHKTLAPHAATLAMGLFATSISGVWLAAPALGATGAQAAVYENSELLSGELIVNGGAEAGSSTGWTAGLDVFQHGVNGYPESVVVDANGLTGETFEGGANLFVGAGAASNSTQVVDVNPAADAIDNGATRAVISAFVGGFAAQDDNATVVFEFFDALGNSVHSVQFGPIYAADRGGVSGFVGFNEPVALAPGVRSVEVTVSTIVTFGVNDGAVDNLSLRLETPSVVLQPDHAQAMPGEPVTITPLANDQAGEGASIMPQSLRFVVNGQETTEVNTGVGVWQVNAQTGSAAFTPAAGVTEATDVIAYRVRDSSGQSAESTMTVEVLAPQKPEEPGLPPTEAPESPPVVEKEATRPATAALKNVIEPELAELAPFVEEAVSMQQQNRGVSVARTLELETPHSVGVGGIPLSVCAFLLGGVLVGANRRIARLYKARG